MQYLAVISAMGVALASTLSFSGVNAAWFSTRQMAGGAGLSAGVGFCAGVLLSQLPDGVAGGGLAALFCLMNERMLHTLFPSRKKLFTVCLVFASALLAFWVGLLPHAVLAALLLLSAALDMRGHWHDKKLSVFSFDALKAATAEPAPTHGALQLQNTPNIYVLFLESIHSAQALRELYDMDDGGLADFLRGEGFTVYENSFSNELYTTASLYSLLQMKPCAEIAYKEPEVFRILRANGYGIQLFDTYYHTMHPYAQYASYFNYTIPHWVGWLYDKFIPFFMQSKIFMSLTQGIDPFSDQCSYDVIKQAFTQRLSIETEKKQCYIMRFGAQHTPIEYTWKARDPQWVDFYTKLYLEVVAQIREMIACIMAHDRQACIFMMGDHGAWQYRASWQGRADPNEALLEKGLEPAHVAQDLSGVLLAVRPPDGRALEQRVLTPINAFRLVFSLLRERESLFLDFLPNETFLREPGQIFPYVLVREGVPLQRWERDSVESAAARNAMILERNPDDLDGVLALMETYVSGGDLHRALNALETARQRLGNLPELLIKIAEILMRWGKADQAYRLLLPALAESNDARLLYPLLISMSLCKGPAQAQTFLEKHPAAKELTETRRCETAAHIHMVRGDVERAEPWLRALSEQPLGKDLNEIQIQLQHMVRYAWALDALGRTEAALETLLRVPDDIVITAGSPILPVTAALALRLRHWEKAEASIKKTFTVMSQPPLTLHLWLAGALEGQERNEEALEILERLEPQMKTRPHFMAQIGMFAIRHGEAHGRFRAHKNMGALYLRDMRQRVRDIFDGDFYRRCLGDLLPEHTDPLTHFLHHARLWGLDPCPLFNTLYYVSSYHDLFYQGIDPVWHYLICSPFEWRNASLRFPTLSYMVQHPKLPWPHVNPLCHAMRERRQGA